MWALGKAIAHEVGAADDGSITGKWIAHYLAEQMLKARDDPTGQREIADLILQLWRSRRHFPGGDPLAEYDRLAKAFAEYAFPETRHPHVYFDVDPPSRRSTQPSQQDEWFSIASDLDRFSSLLIAESYRTASPASESDAAKLAELANSIDPDSQTLTIRIVRTLLDKDAEDPVMEDNKRTEDAIKSLTSAISRFKRARAASS